MFLAIAIRQASRYSIGATPTARLNRSKNADRERAASLANWATVHCCAGFSCMQRIAAASRSSASPRNSPCDAAIPADDRSASMSSTSSRRVRTTSRAGREARDSSPTSCTSVASRLSPRICTSWGRSETSNAASGEPNRKCPIKKRTSGTPLCVPSRNSPSPSRTGAVTVSLGDGGAMLDIERPNPEGIKTKSSVCSVIGS